VHVDPKAAVAVQSHRFRGDLWIGGALVPLVLAIGGLAFVLVTLFDPNNPVHRSGDYAMLACCGFLGFVMPLSGALGALASAIREMRRAEAIEALLACMREGRLLDRDAHTSLVGAARSRRPIVDALVVESAALVEPLHAPRQWGPEPPQPGHAGARRPG